MRKIKEILRLRWEAGLSARQIAHSLSISHSTVLDMLRRAERAGFIWPLSEVDDATLKAKLYPGNPDPKRPRPDRTWSTSVRVWFSRSRARRSSASTPVLL